MSAAALIIGFQILSLVGSAITAAKLFVTGLSVRYKFFFWYFLFRVPNTAWPLFFNSKSKFYFYFWVATEPVTWIFHTVMVLELYRLVLEKHRGLYTLGRWVLFAGLGTSVTISLASLIPRMPKAITEQSKTFWAYLAIERGVMLGLAILLMFLMAFLVLYTVPISANIRTHARIYSVFFVSTYLALLLASFLGLHVHSSVNLALNAISVACVFAWLFLLSPKGEEIKSSAPILGPEQERRVLQQLDALNATLLKVSRN